MFAYVLLPEIPVCAAMTVCSPMRTLCADLHEVVDFYPGGDLSGFERAAIDGGVRADFHVVGNFDSADLREFPVAAFAEDVAEAVAADDGAGVNFDAIAEPRAGVERDARMQRCNSAPMCESRPMKA